MASHSSATARYIIEEPASPEETQRLFGIKGKRAAKLDRWVTEALAVEHVHHASKKKAKSGSKHKARHSAKKPALVSRTRARLLSA
jgi:hypothetical protein